MTLSEFIKQYDRNWAVVLLEGKRKVAEGYRNKLHELGKLLASKTEKMIFRSGNAAGSDQFFSEGVAEVDHKRLQVITPCDNHRKNANKAAYIIRDTVKAIGTVYHPPGHLWHFLRRPQQNHVRSGGTRHTMNTCRQNGIPILDQKIWMNWLE